MARVLVIEDEAPLRETLVSYLHRDGHEVVAASNGREALQRSLSTLPDVLVADWMLQNHLHGLHLSETFRAVKPGLQTILITGYPSDDLEAESQRSGVFELLEKPFGLEDLRRAVSRAVGADPRRGRARPIAAVEADEDGVMGFQSQRARELLASVGPAGAPQRLSDWLAPEDLGRVLDAAPEWVEVQPLGSEETWLVQGRRRSEARRVLLVLVPGAEAALRHDPRVRILLDERPRAHPALPERGPVVVIEREDAVRRLLVSQLERLGVLCYPTDDLEAALRLLAGEPQVDVVLVDFSLAGPDVASWVDRIRAVRPEARVIGTGGAGSEPELRDRTGVESVLPKPWRLSDLLALLAGDAPV